MAVGLDQSFELLPIRGIRLASADSGIAYGDRHDLVLMAIEPGSLTAAVFTTNAFCAAPVELARAHLARTAPRFLLINSGNANAGVGDQGLADALRCCQRVAHLGECSVEQVLPFSTGVIGERLPADRIVVALPELVATLKADGWSTAAAAIMTTDTVPKGVSKTIDMDGTRVTLTGIAKGAGMIRPNMATMLSFIATDVLISQRQLDDLLKQAVADSFNSITVDGDTSTNDACVLIATGQAGIVLEEDTGPAYEMFSRALAELMTDLAVSIVRDGEGATRFITIKVENAVDRDEARQVAYTVAHSPLVKTAFFAADPNWGRILAAVGRAGVDHLDTKRIAIFLDELPIVRAGAADSGYAEVAGQAVMQRPEITVRIVLNRGDQEAIVWTTDLSHDYVRINAEYRT